MKEDFTDFIVKNGLSYLNTKFTKNRSQLQKYTGMKGSHSQIDYILMTKKWINGAISFQAYNSSEL